MTDPDDGLGNVAECERTLLRDVARIRGTLPPALAMAEDFIIGWLDAHPEREGTAYFDSAPDEFIAARRATGTAESITGLATFVSSGIVMPPKTH